MQGLWVQFLVRELGMLHCVGGTKTLKKTLIPDCIVRFLLTFMMTVNMRILIKQFTSLCQVTEASLSCGVVGTVVILGQMCGLNVPEQ